MSPLLRDAGRVDQVLFHPGPADRIDGPDAPARDIRDICGETLDAAGVVAVNEAARLAAERASVLVVMRDLGGHDGAALVVNPR